MKIKRRIVTLLAQMHFFGNPSAKLKIVGVTGTNGKTTTTTLLYQIAKELGYKAGLIGTVENIIDDEVLETNHTTPDPLELNRLLSKMVDNGCEYVFMEVSSHAVDQNRVAGIKFKGGIFTNLTHDHLDYHKNIDNYFKAKQKFFQMLPKDAFALSNADDEYGLDILKGANAERLYYGFKGHEDFHGEILKKDFSGLGLDFNGNKINSKLLGQFNAYNLLAVWSACILLGFDKGKVNKIMESITPPRGRFDHFLSSSGVLVVVDYAHTPDALENIFSAVRDVVPRGNKLISLVGCGGDRDPMKRPKMGQIGAEMSDLCIFTSDNPRSEDPNKILTDMQAELNNELKNKVQVVSDRLEAIKKAVREAKEGDVILCAGKGHETYQEVKGVKHHFNDKEELERAF